MYSLKTIQKAESDIKAFARELISDWDMNWIGLLIEAHKQYLTSTSGMIIDFLPEGDCQKRYKLAKDKHRFMWHSGATWGVTQNEALHLIREVIRTGDETLINH